MLRSLFVLVIATLSFTGVALAQKAPPPPLPAGSCAKRKDCVRQPTCAAGQTLVALPAHRFVCRVSSTQVEAKEAPRCERGALVVAEGFDYCEWTVTDEPAAAALLERVVLGATSLRWMLAVTRSTPRSAHTADSAAVSTSATSTT